LTTLNGSNGFQISGEAANDASGNSVSAAGDVNGDGFADLLIGALRANPNGSQSGASYVVFGHATGTLNRTGTEARDILSGGEFDDSFTGLGGDDFIRSGDGDDTINGGQGNDIIIDGAGNDTLNAGSGRDTILVTSGEDRIDGGSDKDLLDCRNLINAININLANGTFVHPNGEDLIALFSIEDVRGTAFNDVIVGGLAANFLLGQAGNDTLDGGASADLLEGGLGRDTMTGGAAADRFIFRAITESGNSAATRDIVTDFTVNPAAGAAFVDRIDLNVIDAQAGTAGAQAFTFIAGAAFTAEGQVRAVQSGANTILEINTTGVGVADMTIQLSNFTATNLTAADFIL
ncbi:MAG: calcium-binding protein, partial [Aestuariivirga sp.]